MALGSRHSALGVGHLALSLSALGTWLSALGTGAGPGSRRWALGSRHGTWLSAHGTRLSALGTCVRPLGAGHLALGLSALGTWLSAHGTRLSALGTWLSAHGTRHLALGSRRSALVGAWLWLSAPGRSAHGSRLSSLDLVLGAHIAWSRCDGQRSSQASRFCAADDLALRVYHATRGLPREERYGLQAQIRRAALSVASNIFEGCARRTDKEYGRFINVALGSAAETHCLFSVVRRLEMLPGSACARLEAEYEILLRTLNRLLASIDAFE